MSSKLYIGNIPFKMSEAELKDLFSSCGTVLNVSIPTDRQTGRPRGFAFVELDSEEAAQQAISNYDGADVGGRSLKVSAASENSSRSSGGRPSSNRRYAKNVGEGSCIFCNTTTALYGFENSEYGACTSCIYSLNKIVNRR